MSTPAAPGIRRWLLPERGWRGTRALVPVDTCYRILEIFLWFVGILAPFGLILGYQRAPDLLRHHPLFWLGLTAQIPVILAAIFRGWPFVLRHAILLAAISVFAVSVSLVVGQAPNMVFFVIVAVLTTSLFYGARLGLTVAAGFFFAQALIAAGWVLEVFPLGVPVDAHSRLITDFTDPLVWVRVTVIAFGMQAGLVLFMRYVLRDLNEALREANRTLHKLAVEQEHRARAEEARLRAEHAAREAQKFDALGRMAGGVAHDFNNALCVIKGWSSVLLEDVRDPEIREAMGDIKRASDNAAQLTHHLLAFSRHDPTKREVTNLSETIRVEAKTLRRLLPPDVEVTAEIGEPVHVLLGRGQLQEIILNLSINARDAMPRGGRLSFKVSAVETAGPDEQRAKRYARCEITDTGMGMDEATRAHIFEPFFTTKAPGKGTGLGLAMVYGIISGAGGWIEVKSTPGHGTTFTLFLPEVAAADAHVEPPVAAILHPTRCRVLLVDGQQEVRAVVEHILAKEGFPVMAVATGEDALAALEGPAGGFGLLITEGIVAGAPASAVIARALLLNAACRVIVASAHQPDQLVQRGIDTGSYILLAKPFDASLLREAVNDAIGRKMPVVGAGTAAT